MLVAKWRFVTTTAKSHRINMAIKIKIQELQFLFNCMFRYMSYMNIVLQDLIITNFISE